MDAMNGVAIDTDKSVAITATNYLLTPTGSTALVLTSSSPGHSHIENVGVAWGRGYVLTRDHGENDKLLFKYVHS